MTVLAESRVLPASMELRDVEVGKRYIEGRAVPYGVRTNLGWYTEIIERGLFGKIGDLPLMLFHDAHSLDTLVGLSQQWIERNDGLHGVWKLDNSDVAQRAARMAADGILGWLSVGFQPIKSNSEYDQDDHLTITRTEARLLEVSLVPTPAYSEAIVTKVRSREPMTHPEITGRTAVAGWREWLESQGVGSR